MPLPPLSPEQLIKPRYFEARIALIFASLFVSTGVNLPYFPLWLEANGFDPERIAVILAAPMFLRVVTTPLITAYADRARDRADVLLLLVAASVVVCCGYFLPTAYGVVLGVTLALSIVWTPQGPLADSLALSGVRRFGSNYSHMRIWGSIAFLSANFGGGVILSWTSPQAVPVIMTLSLGVGLVAVAMAPRLGRPRLSSPLSVEALQDAPKLLGRHFVLFVAGAGVINGSHGFMYGFVSIYWKSIGLGNTLMGFLWAAAVVAEVCIFLVYTRVFGRFRATTLLMLSGAAAVLRWIAYPLDLAARTGRAGLLRRSGAARPVDGHHADRRPEADRRIGRRRADRRRAGRCLLRHGNLHGDGDPAFRPALRPLRRAGLLRDGGRCRDGPAAGLALGRVSPRAPARGVIRASRDRSAPAIGRAPTAAARRDR